MWQRAGSNVVSRLSRLTFPETLAVSSRSTGGWLSRSFPPPVALRREEGLEYFASKARWCLVLLFCSFGGLWRICSSIRICSTGEMTAWAIDSLVTPCLKADGRMSSSTPSERITKAWATARSVLNLAASAASEEDEEVTSEQEASGYHKHA